MIDPSRIWEIIQKHRWLKISLSPALIEGSDVDLEKLKTMREYRFALEIENPASQPNSIRAWRCFAEVGKTPPLWVRLVRRIDPIKYPARTHEPDMLARPLAPSEIRRGQVFIPFVTEETPLRLQLENLVGVRFEFEPVHGFSQVKHFNQADLWRSR